MDFPGVALVTGAASGIGKATAIQYAVDGCQRIVIADLKQEGLSKTQEEIEARHPEVQVKTILVDVCSRDSVQAMVDFVINEFGRIDYCVNSAGIIRFGNTVELSESDFEAVYQVNLRGVFFCVKAQIAAMLKQEPLITKNSPFPARGAIVNISSQAGLMGNGNLPSYVASKHAVNGLSKSVKNLEVTLFIILTADATDRTVKSSLLKAFDTIETPILGDLPQGEEGEIRKRERKAEIAMGRIGQPSEIAHCAIFLTSGRSSFVTATTLAVHGGIKNQ